MPDVFISYAHEDRARVAPFAMALELLGYDVWWDSSLAPNEVYSKEIARALDSAAKVVVIWSRASIESEWVISEAKRAGDRLIPLCLDRVAPPNPFNVRHTLDFTSWAGDSEADCWRKLRDGLRSALGERAGLIQSPRIALVIGIGGYQRARLDNPVRDATALHASLQRLNFESTLLLDVDWRTMRQEISKFGAKLIEAGPEAAGLFYFAGHGMQAGEKNYLFPVDAEINSEADLESHCIAADTVLRQMDSAENKVNVLLLDACRDNPFARGFRSVARGLASMNAPSGTLISYATGLGEIAHDGDGKHSPYTQALLDLIESETIKVEELFKRVRTRVRDATGKKQTPWESTSLHGEDFYFRPPPRRAATRSERDIEAEIRAEYDKKFEALAAEKARSENDIQAQIRAEYEEKVSALEREAAERVAERDRLVAAERAARAAEAQAQRAATSAKQLYEREQQARITAERQAGSRAEIDARRAAEQEAFRVAENAALEAAALRAKAEEESRARERAQAQERADAEKRKRSLEELAAAYLKERAKARAAAYNFSGRMLRAAAQPKAHTPHGAARGGLSLFGTPQQVAIRSARPLVARINTLEPTFEALSDESLRNNTSVYRHRLAKGARLDELLPEAFASVREAAKRALGLRAFDVQLMAGIQLHRGKIISMADGEGKTLAAAFATYLNALESRGVHVVVPNDYLAQRDAQQMGAVYRFLGLSVGVIVHGIRDNERRQAYAADVTYCTNTEVGFDYLRDNMKYSLGEMVQRGRRFAIVDEVDSILIDEARTPLIITGPTADLSDFYKSIDALIALLKPKHYRYDEKRRSVAYTESGLRRIEELLIERGFLQGSLHDFANVSLMHHANQALRANHLLLRDTDYIVKNGEIILLDESTGRVLQGRRLSEGLHQAVEAKEDVEIKPENQTLASISFQNYFRLYDKLAGMSGTAATEEEEFSEIYNVDVVEIPTNRPVRRVDEDDEVYRTATEKYRAILANIEYRHRKSQPVFVGTASIEKMEIMSALLKQRGIPHQVLSGRHHEQDALVIAQAGVPGAVTIAPNMAGRGADIQLGGDVDVRLKAALRGDETFDQIALLKRNISVDVEKKKEIAIRSGGLYALGTERHETRRTDNQLRSRAGRHGEPGKSKFYVCLEDDLLQIFAADRLDAIMRGLGIQEDEAIVHPWMNKALQTSQRRVEQRYFEIRKNLVRYDNTINDQRRAIFEHRLEFIRTTDVTSIIVAMADESIRRLVDRYGDGRLSAPKLEALREDLEELAGHSSELQALSNVGGASKSDLIGAVRGVFDAAYAQKVVLLGNDRRRAVEKQVLLSVIDMRWREHLLRLDQLRAVISLRPSAQRDALKEFKAQSLLMFERMVADISLTVTRMLLRLEVGSAEAAPSFDKKDPTTWGKVPRNAPCPCGSGKKYRYCHGAHDSSA